MRSTVLLVGIAALATANAAVLQPRDACGNGVKIRGSGSVSCSNNTCRACNNEGQCCTVARPSSSNCDNNTPYLNFDTCKSESANTGGSRSSVTPSKLQTSTTPSRSQSNTGSTSVSQSTGRNSFLDRLRALFGGR